MSEYNSDQIQVLEGLSAVRKRPGMYIGSTSSAGLHHCVYEVIDNSIDEALAGFCNKIVVEILKDNVIRVTDNGRGIPVGIHAKYNVSAMEIVLTKLHAGGKFEGKAYKVSGGLHGVGVSCVNALSEWMKVTSKQGGKIHQIDLARGLVTKAVRIVGDATDNGTMVEYKADAEIFETLEYSFDILSKRLRELAFLNKGIKIEIYDRRHEEEKFHIFEFSGGIVSFIEHLNKNKKRLHERPIYFEIEKDGVMVEIAIEYNDNVNEIFYSYVNNINTVEGGTHVTGFRTALTRVCNTFLDKLKLKPKTKDGEFLLSSDDTREGLTAVVSVKMPDPQFDGQTKGKLGSSHIAPLVRDIVENGLTLYFDTHPAEAKLILSQAVIAYQAREAAKRARDLTRKKSAMSSDTLPGKLADCSEKDPTKTEVYIVEGDSAGGSAKMGRDRAFQAILPLWGKMLNVEKARIDKIIGNEKLLPVIAALGAGVGDDFDLARLRYHRVIIMADADVDGSHIRTLLLTFFFRYMRPLVEAGHIYLACPPLYKIWHNKKIEYAFSDTERNFHLTNTFAGLEPTVQRFKGLGEMNPDQLYETTMRPETRKLVRVQSNDYVVADDMFTVLMGDEVAPRRDFIYKYAKEVTDLDI